MIINYLLIMIFKIHFCVVKKWKDNEWFIVKKYSNVCKMNALNIQSTQWILVIRVSHFIGPVFRIQKQLLYID